ncbi:MAG: short-chain dehydrogenase [Acidobacteria bacterium]|jgi:NAD(P)-dependent dehydrogenase (short-subunit alcohol dehydrogenase family)|nr:MAG: short-chain dehydrogenase [Acidobacteriota bacterium]
MFDLTGNVAIVTGSSRGIGRAIAEALSRAGAKVVISSRKADACESVAAALRQEGCEAVAIPCHIGRREDVDALVAKTREHWGRIDTLVCNAAVNPYFGPMTGLTDAVFTKVMESNVRSILWLANLVQPEMAARRDGVIIIVSSIGGLKGTDTLGIYAISKAADMQLARNLAVEWGPHNIRVNCIAPGLVRTDFARALWEDATLREGSESRTALHRLGEPEDIAGAAVFLAARSGRWITGQTIVIDGGRMIT